MGVMFSSQKCGCVLLEPDDGPSYIGNDCGDENCAAKTQLRTEEMNRPYPPSLLRWIDESVEEDVNTIGKHICKMISDGDFTVLDDGEDYFNICVCLGTYHFKTPIVEKDVEYVRSCIKK